MNLTRSTTMKIISIIISIFACIYAIVEGVLFGYFIALFVGIGEGLGGTAMWLSASTMAYLGLACIIFGVIDLIAAIVTVKAPRAGGIILCFSTAYIITFGVIFCIFASGQIGAVFFALGGIALNVASTVFAFLAAKYRSETTNKNTVHSMANSMEAGDMPIDVAPIPMDSNAAIEDGATPLDATESLTALNALKGSATLPNDIPLPDDSTQHNKEE